MEVVPIFSLRPPPLLDAKKLCKPKAEVAPIFRMRPPPFLDAKINSSCRPVEADWAHLNEDPLMPGYLKMCELNVEIRRREKNDFIAAKGKSWKVQARANRNKRKYCTICSQCEGQDGKMRIYNHIHYSSKDDRVRALVNEDGQYWCKNCIKYHYVKTGEQIPLVISSSTLAGWREDPEVFDQEGDDFHIDWDLCRGAKIRTAIHSTLAQYSEYPVDAFIMLGLNDFLDGATASRIWHSLTKLTTLVRAIAPDHWTGPSTAALGTVLMPPILCRFTTSVVAQQHTPLVDRKHDIMIINRRIGEYNNSFHLPGSIYPLSQPYYTPTVSTSVKNNELGLPRNQMDLAIGHKYHQWREDSFSEQLHLGDAKRWKMGRAILTYFKELFGVSTFNVTTYETIV